MSGVPAAGYGEKERDYWWTVLAVDPIAVPLARLVGERRWLTADQATWISVVLGLPVGIAYSLGSRTGLVIGAALFYVSFLFDCVDGKLARALGTVSPKGKTLDELADGARRGSASLGLAVHLWQTSPGGAFWWAVAYGFLASYFALISGGTRGDAGTAVATGWSQTLARWRLLPTPGTPDVAALVFIVGPVTGLVVPCLVVGCALFALAILLISWRIVRR